MSVNKKMNMQDARESDLSEKLISALNQSGMAHEEMLAVLLPLVISLMESTRGNRIEMQLSGGKRLNIELSQAAH